MKEKFTPGKWEIERMSKGRPPYQIAPKGVYVVCGFTHPRIDSMPMEMREANAALIASAPDLYDALKQFTEMFTDTKKYPDPETITTGLRIFLPKALDALKKAKGEA